MHERETKTAPTPFNRKRLGTRAAALTLVGASVFGVSACGSDTSAEHQQPPAASVEAPENNELSSQLPGRIDLLISESFRDPQDVQTSPEANAIFWHDDVLSYNMSQKPDATHVVTLQGGPNDENAEIANSFAIQLKSDIACNTIDESCLEALQNALVISVDVSTRNGSESAMAVITFDDKGDIAEATYLPGTGVVFSAEEQKRLAIELVAHSSEPFSE